jgi:hypothetical protein
MIKILPTDTAFIDSPDAGPNCLCSRCGKAITRDDNSDFFLVPIRVWSDFIPLKAWNIKEKIEKDDITTPQPHEKSNLRSTTWEYRYHPTCQGLEI